MSEQPAPKAPESLESPPPVFGTWRRAYWVLALALLAYIALGWALTRAYA